jgi:hypothetical protein
MRERILASRERSRERGANECKKRERIELNNGVDGSMHAAYGSDGFDEEAGAGKDGSPFGKRPVRPDKDFAAAYGAPNPIYLSS